MGNVGHFLLLLLRVVVKLVAQLHFAAVCWQWNYINIVIVIAADLFLDCCFSCWWLKSLSLCREEGKEWFLFHTFRHFLVCQEESRDTVALTSLWLRKTHRGWIKHVMPGAIKQEVCVVVMRANWSFESGKWCEIKRRRVSAAEPVHVIGCRSNCSLKAPTTFLSSSSSSFVFVFLSFLFCRRPHCVSLH